jgi:hypothetical protein
VTHLEFVDACQNRPPPRRFDNLLRSYAYSKIKDDLRKSRKRIGKCETGEGMMDYINLAYLPPPLFRSLAYLMTLYVNHSQHKPFTTQFIPPICKSSIHSYLPSVYLSCDSALPIPHPHHSHVFPLFPLPSHLKLLQSIIDHIPPKRCACPEHRRVPEFRRHVLDPFMMLSPVTSAFVFFNHSSFHPLILTPPLSFPSLFCHAAGTHEEPGLSFSKR